MDLTGMFTYMADTAMFMDCRNGRRFPVAMEGAYIDLERAYMNSGKESGQAIQAVVRGRYLARPAMEGDADRVHLIVDRFDGFLPGACEPEPLATLKNTYWKLTRLGGKAIVVSADGEEAHMILQQAGARVRGNGGCNQFFGGFELEENRLTFTNVGSTMKFCPEGSATEQGLFAVLEKSTTYRIRGEVLELMDGDEVLARFEAVYF
jgi:copper homeostasis protein (lipoprotein)